MTTPRDDFVIDLDTRVIEAKDRLKGIYHDLAAAFADPDVLRKADREFTRDLLRNARLAARYADLLAALIKEESA